MERYKEINGTLIINGNDEGFRLSFPTEKADRLLSIYRQAQDTVLKGIEEEEQYRHFDKWLRDTEPELYREAMNAFVAELDLRLQECTADGDGYCCGLVGVENPVCMDGGYYWSETRNDIAIESFTEINQKNYETDK